MMNQSHVHATTSHPHSEATLRGGPSSFSEFSDGAQLRPGGLGGAANQQIYRGVLAAPMLASLNNTQPKNSNNQHQNNKTKMNKSKTQNHQNTLHKLIHLITVTSLLFFSIFTSACSTLYHKREAAMYVLDEQNALLHALKLERESSAIQTKTVADPILSKAEEHLRQAIKSLTKSNQALRAEF